MIMMSHSLIFFTLTLSLIGVSSISHDGLILCRCSVLHMHPFCQFLIQREENLPV